jgi:hypothetical protein
MSANTSLAIRIAAVFDNKGLKNAEKGIKGLQGTVKKLAGAAGIGLSTAAVINFGKQAAKAFIADEKAASRLAQSVKNMGFGFQTPQIEKFISELSSMSGVTDDQLRPSMQQLLQTTGSVTKSQELLTQALDISRGSGIAYETVVKDLSLAYVGQTKGLGKYSLGLTKAELKAMSFAQVQTKLTDQFSGANAQYLTTYAGKMELLSTASGEAQESIGKGLVTALSLLSGTGNTVQPLADSMQDFGTYVGDAIVGTALLIEKLNQVPGMGGKNVVSKNAFALFPTTGALSILKKGLDYVSKTGKEYQALTNPVSQGYLGSMPVGIYPSSAELTKQRQAEADRVKREKELAALTKKGLLDAKKKVALDKASKTLNLEAIGIEAALKGKISETDRLSLLLQRSILQGNATLSTQLSDQLEAAVKRQNELNALLLKTPKAPNPYEDWKIPADLLAYTAASLGVSPETLVNAPQTIPTQTTDSTQELMDAFLAAQAAQDKADAAAAAAEAAAVYVKITLPDGTDMTSQAKTELSNQALSGSFVNVNRLGRFANTPVPA